MAGGTALMEMVPTRGDPWGNPMDAPAAPGLRRFSFVALPNPLLQNGTTDAVWARGFRFQIEQALQRMQTERLAKSQARDGGLNYAPMHRIEADLHELERAEAMRKKLGKAESLSMVMEGENTDVEGHYRRKQSIADAAVRIAWELDRSCAGNLELETRVLDRFWAKLAQEKFLSPDMMSLLLIAQEEVLWSQDPSAAGAAGSPASVTLHAEPGMGPAKSGDTPITPGSMTAPRPSSLQESREHAGQAARAAELQVRLISIREMLWHYFQAYPQDYPAALAAVLGVSIGDLQDDGVMDERIAFEVARSGAWSLAMRVWQEIVHRQEMKAAGRKSGGRERPNSADEAWNRTLSGKWAGSGLGTRGSDPAAGAGGTGRGGAFSTNPYLVGVVPPRGHSSWWSLSPRWSGMPMPRLLASLVSFITS